MVYKEDYTLKKYVCSICGYVYEETKGDLENGVSPGTKWEDVPEDWLCPLCGASKSDFEEEIVQIPNVQENNISHDEEEKMRELTFGEVSALCSNLSKGCTKQYRLEEAELFNQLSDFYDSKSSAVENGNLKDLIELINSDLKSSYENANLIASDVEDRGALRALLWSEKVTKILKSILGRYDQKQDELLESTHIYVCEICGFIYIGDKLPDVCPVCKVPKEKIIEVKRG